ncbi:MAG: rhodanese-like domain-containing protein [Rhodospirillales bacterium]|nr:rhodanese-like domain-containing protein [Rhodospirillales bacterium]
MTDETYAGDLSPQDTWELLKTDARAVLIDVRTDAEFSYVGVVDMSPLNKKTVYANWLFYPDMDLNPGFTEELVSQKFDKDQPLLFLCRSGVRSKHAAIAMTRLGYSRCYNIAGGFEGDKDASLHRASHNGWKHAGLPWVQE